MDPQTIIHPIPPLFDERSRVLILGSFPSVKSREAQFFYGHPQNRFWRVMAQLFNEPVPADIDSKRALMLDHHVALWDTIHSCSIVGSSDSSIRDVVPNDLSPILSAAPIGRIFCNGATSHRLYTKYIFPVTGIEAYRLPSTSPANAAFSFEQLCESWRQVAEIIEKNS